MQISRTTSLLLISLLITPQTKTVDPITALAAAAAGAALGTAGYFAYDYAHYQSGANCYDALQKLNQQLHAHTTLLTAARENSVSALLPTYNKLVPHEYDAHRSLHITQLTQNVQNLAKKEIEPLIAEQQRIQRYARYHEYSDEAQQCDDLLRTIQYFYAQLHEHAVAAYLTNTLHGDLNQTLVQAINQRPSHAAYPFHAHLKDLQRARGIYQKFVNDNHISHYISHEGLQTAQDLMAAIRQSTEFKLEEKDIEIDKLKAEKCQLENTVERQRKENRSLERTNSELSSENTTLLLKVSRLNRLVNELKALNCCHECRGHITICLHNNQI